MHHLSRSGACGRKRPAAAWCRRAVTPEPRAPPARLACEGASQSLTSARRHAAADSATEALGAACGLSTPALGNFIDWPPSMFPSAPTPKRVAAHPLTCRQPHYGLGCAWVGRAHVLHHVPHVACVGVAGKGAQGGGLAGRWRKGGAPGSGAQHDALQQLVRSTESHRWQLLPLCSEIYLAMSNAFMALAGVQSSRACCNSNTRSGTRSSTAACRPRRMQCAKTQSAGIYRRQSSSHLPPCTPCHALDAHLVPRLITRGRLLAVRCRCPGRQQRAAPVPPPVVHHHPPAAAPRQRLRHALAAVGTAVATCGMGGQRGVWIGPDIRGVLAVGPTVPPGGRGGEEGHENNTWLEGRGTCTRVARVVAW